MRPLIFFGPLALLGTLLLAVTPGCSGGGKSAEGDAPVAIPAGGKAGSASSKPRSLIVDAANAYRAGDPDKARQTALRYADHALEGVEGEKKLEYKLMHLQQVAFAADIVAQFEKELAKSNAKPSVDSSRKVVTAFLAKVDHGKKLVADQVATVTLAESERSYLTMIDKYHASAVKNWILMHPREERGELYQSHRKLLESQGIRATDVVNALGAQ